MATGQGLTAVREKEILDCYLRGAAITAPGGLFVALFGAVRWSAATVFALNSFVVATSSGNTRLFKATAVSGTGTTGGSEPTWPSTDGGTVVDNAGANQITWTEQTLAFDAQADATTTFVSELTGNGYARLSIGQANFPASSAISGSQTGSQSQNASAITFAAATGADWKPVVGFALCKTGTTGYLYWGRLSTQLIIAVGQAAQFNANGLTVQMD